MGPTIVLLAPVPTTCLSRSSITKSGHQYPHRAEYLPALLFPPCSNGGFIVGGHTADFPSRTWSCCPKRPTTDPLTFDPRRAYCCYRDPFPHCPLSTDRGTLFVSNAPWVSQFLQLLTQLPRCFSPFRDFFELTAPSIPAFGPLIRILSAIILSQVAQCEHSLYHRYSV